MRLFETYPELSIALSEKTDGSCRLHITGNSAIDGLTAENRRVFAKKMGVDASCLVAADLVHGNKVSVVGECEVGSVIAKTDGLITREPSIFLSVTVADCLPIFLYDPVQKNIGLLHAGWRGLAQGIIAGGVGAMIRELGSEAKNIRVAVGPGIGACHFEVGEEVAAKFSKYGSEWLEERGGKLFLDLKKIASKQLGGAGVGPSAIEASDECTYCLPEKYFSYRRDKPELVEAMMVIYGMRRES